MIYPKISYTIACIDGISYTIVGIDDILYIIAGEDIRAEAACSLVLQAQDEGEESVCGGG